MQRKSPCHPDEGNLILHAFLTLPLDCCLFVFVLCFGLVWWRFTGTGQRSPAAGYCPAQHPVHPRGLEPVGWTSVPETDAEGTVPEEAEKLRQRAERQQLQLGGPLDSDTRWFMKIIDIGNGASNRRDINLRVENCLENPKTCILHTDFYFYNFMQPVWLVLRYIFFEHVLG